MLIVNCLIFILAATGPLLFAVTPLLGLPQIVCGHPSGNPLRSPLPEDVSCCAHSVKAQKRETVF